MSSRSWSNVSICLPSWTLFSLTINFFRASSSSSSSQLCEPPLAMVWRGLRGEPWKVAALRAASAAGPALGLRPRPEGDCDLSRPSLSLACPAAAQRRELRRLGEKRKQPPRDRDLRIAKGRWEKRTPPSWPVLGKWLLEGFPL